MTNLQKTLTTPAKATILAPDSERYKTIAASIESKYGFRPNPQFDLLYVESCLVTAGFNENDDVFSPDELWAARHTPVLKPFNWQHKEQDIMGVIFSVEARLLDGTVIPFDQEDTPSEPFELFTEAAIFQMIHSDRAAEIKERFAKSNLYVSMEAFFNDYDYVIAGSDETKIVARNKDTAFLEKNLKAKGGTGKYQGQRIGRGLRGITFGGCGFVDVPANKRSDITQVAEMASAGESKLLDELRRFMGSLEEKLRPVLDLGHKEQLMNTVANTGDKNPDMAAMITAAIQSHEDAKAKAAAEAALRAKASELEAANTDLASKNTVLEQAATERSVQVDSLNKQVENLGVAVDELVQSIAGATGSTPAEISAIDAAKSGADAFAAKIAWIKKSMASLQARAARADELEGELKTAARELRNEEVRSLYANLVSAEEVESIVAIGSAIADDAEYSAWLKQHQWFASKLTAKDGADAAKMPPAFDKSKDKKDKKKDGSDCKADVTDPNVAVDALLAAGGLQQGNLGLNSGVKPNGLRKPKDKIAGNSNDTASGDPVEALANAEPDDAVDLAGGRAEADAAQDDEPAMRTLASELFGMRDSEDSEDS